MNPVIVANMHLFIQDRKMYGFHMNITNNLREVDFEEDEWRHDNQFTVDAKPRLLVDFNKPLPQPNVDEFDEDFKLDDDEEILPHYII